MLLWTWGCRGLFHTPHPIHFSLSPLLLSWSKFPFLASFYSSLPPILSLAINFLTQFQFGFIPKECMYIVLKFGIKNWHLVLDRFPKSAIHSWSPCLGHQETCWVSGEACCLGIGHCSVCAALRLWDFPLEVWVMDSRAHRLSSCSVQT